MSQQQHLNIFCPDHRIRLPVAGPGLLSCDNGPHVLAGDFAFDFWKYCCQCDTFSPLRNKEGDPYDRCACCGYELEDHWYLCENCRVFTTRPRADGPRKKFHLPLRGKGPLQPSCPGCVLETDLNLREHLCESLFDMKADVYWHYRRLAMNRPPVMKLADPLNSKHEVQENEDVVLTATAVEPDGDSFVYVWEVVMSSALIVDDGKPEVTLKTTGLHPVSQPLRIVVSVKAPDSYGAESNAREIELFVTNPNLSRANSVPIISDLTCGCANWEARAGDRVVLNAAVSDPDGDELIYDWHTDPHGLIVGNGPSVLLDTSPVKPQMLAFVVVSLPVVDGRSGQQPKIERPLTVLARPAPGGTPPPATPEETLIVDLRAPDEGTWVNFGDVVTLTASIRDGRKDNLTYEWKTSTNRYEKTDKAIYTFKVEEARDPFVDITVTVTDGRGKGSASLKLKVRQPPVGKTPEPTPQPSTTPATTPRPPAPKEESEGGRAAGSSSTPAERRVPTRPRRVEREQV